MSENPSFEKVPYLNGSSFLEIPKDILSMDSNLSFYIQRGGRVAVVNGRTLVYIEGGEVEVIKSPPGLAANLLVTSIEYLNKVYGATLSSPWAVMMGLGQTLTKEEVESDLRMAAFRVGGRLDNGYVENIEA